MSINSFQCFIFAALKLSNMKKLLVLIFILFVAISADAQSYKGDVSRGFQFAKRWHSAWGLGWYSYPYNGNSENVFAINYSPQMDLTLRYSDLSISLNSQMAAGYHVRLSTDSMKYFYSDLPLFIQGNIGHLSSKDFYSYAGFFAGAGYDFTYIHNQLQQRVIATAGMRTWVGKSSIGIRLCRAFGNAKNPASINSIALDFNVGEYLAKVRDLNKVSNFMMPYSK